MLSKSEHSTLLLSFVPTSTHEQKRKIFFILSHVSVLFNPHGYSSTGFFRFRQILFAFFVNRRDFGSQRGYKGELKQGGTVDFWLPLPSISSASTLKLSLMQRPTPVPGSPGTGVGFTYSSLAPLQMASASAMVFS